MPRRPRLALAGIPWQKTWSVPNYLNSTVLDEIRSATNGNYALGNDRFKEEIEAMLKRRARPGKRGRPVKKHVSKEL